MFYILLIFPWPLFLGMWLQFNFIHFCLQMKFVESILSNNTTDDHCQEFVTQKGLVPLLSILGLPNLPIDFPSSAACQAVAGVCKSILVFFTTSSWSHALSVAVILWHFQVNAHYFSTDFLISKLFAKWLAASCCWNILAKLEHCSSGGAKIWLHCISDLPLFPSLNYHIS